MGHCVRNNEGDAGTHRTPKALRAKCIRRHIYCFATALGVRARPRVAFVLNMRTIEDVSVK